MSSNRMKSNKAKLCCLIIDQGTETMRKYFDSVHSPADLPAVLNANRTMLNRLRGKVITRQQMDLLFPSSGVTKSSDYDITLLFILIRNICGLYPPVTTGSWDAKPPPFDNSPEANLVRIRYYRNNLYQKNSTEVSDTDFNMYWSEIQDALVGLGASVGDIAKLKMSPLDGDLYIRLLNERYEKDHKIEVLATKIVEKIETFGKDVKKIASDLNECRTKDGKIEHLGNKTETVEEDVKKIGTKTKTVKRIMRKIARNISWIIMRAALWILLLMFVFYLVANSHSGKDL